MKNKIIKGVITEIDWRYIKKQRVIGGKKYIISSITCLFRYKGHLFCIISMKRKENVIKYSIGLKVFLIFSYNTKMKI